MSYQEQDGQVILTMSREDYDELDSALKLVQIFEKQLLRDSTIEPRASKLRERLNVGNPHYIPYQVETKRGGG